MTTETIQAWLIDRIAASWNCPVYDNPPQEQTDPPYAVLERVGEVIDSESPLQKALEQWRYAIYGVFPLSDLVGGTAGEGKREKYQRMRDELHGRTHFVWQNQTYLAVVQVVGYDSVVDVPIEDRDAYTIRMEVIIRA